MSSFDYELKDHLKRAANEERWMREFNLNGAPADYPEDTIAERVTSAETSIDRLETNLAYLAVIYGCAIGILATLAAQHIFGAA